MNKNPFTSKISQFKRLMKERQPQKGGMALNHVLEHFNTEVLRFLRTLTIVLGNFVPAGEQVSELEALVQ